MQLLACRLYCVHLQQQGVNDLVGQGAPDLLTLEASVCRVKSQMGGLATREAGASDVLIVIASFHPAEEVGIPGNDKRAKLEHAQESESWH